MTDQPNFQYSGQPQQPAYGSQGAPQGSSIPPPRSSSPTKPKRRIWPLVAGGVVTLLVGVGIGSSQSGDAPAPEPAPTVTQTETVETMVTAEPEPAPTVTVTAEAETVATVPQACLDALDDGQQILETAREVARLVQGHMEADSVLFSELAEFDYTGMDRYTADLEDFTAGIVAVSDAITGNQFGVNADTCRAEA